MKIILSKIFDNYKKSIPALLFIIMLLVFIYGEIIYNHILNEKFSDDMVSIMENTQFTTEERIFEKTE